MVKRQQQVLRVVCGSRHAELFGSEGESRGDGEGKGNIHTQTEIISGRFSGGNRIF